MPVVKVDVIAGTVRDPALVPWTGQTKVEMLDRCRGIQLEPYKWDVLPQACVKPKLNNPKILMSHQYEAYFSKMTSVC